MEERDRLIPAYLAVCKEVHQAVMVEPAQFIAANGGSGWRPIERAGQLLTAAIVNLYSSRRMAPSLLRRGVLAREDLGLAETTTLIVARFLYDQVVTQILPSLSKEEVGVLREAMQVNLSTNSRYRQVTEADLSDPAYIYRLVADLAASHIKNGLKMTENSRVWEKRYARSIEKRARIGAVRPIALPNQNQTVVKNLFKYRP